MSESIEATPLPPFVDTPAPKRSIYSAAVAGRRRATRPSAREWQRHFALFFITFLTTTFAGTIYASNVDAPEPQMRAFGASWLDYITYVPEYYGKLVWVFLAQALTSTHLLAQGVIFACALLFILAAHEAGHYIFCRRYEVDATLPFFIPAPPLFLAGTFGAFIKIKSPIPSRRALFDIGVAGPIAGFTALLPVALLGLWTAQPARITGEQLLLNDPLLFKLIARALGIHDLAHIAPNPFYFAAWIGLLVTSLNLAPVGQLDGGHAIYAIFGARAHKWLGLVAFFCVATLAILGWRWYGSPSGFLYTILLAVMLRVRHPEAGNQTEQLGHARHLIAWLTLLIFLLSFMPFPLTIN